MTLFAASMIVLADSLMGAQATWSTASAPADGVYRFEFGVGEASAGAYAVPAGAKYDAQGAYDASETFTYGFMGTTETSYADDVVSVEGSGIPTAIDGFSVVQGQQIVLHDTNDLNGVSCVCGPAASEYLPVSASPYEGRYPVRFSMRGEERAYYAVTCTVANASSTTNADVTLFSERCHIIAHHLSLAPGETKTFAWSVELAPNVYKTRGTYHDNAVNVCVVGENAALASLVVVKQPQTAGTVRGEAVANMNIGKTMWLCTDSTGTDQANATPYFSLQNYSGVGSGLSRYAPANLSIRNQGEGGLATNANAHRNSCLLKPGDYLYVEYGHNESGVTSYTNNLETYLSDVNTAGAYLVIVSPVERRTSWDSGTSTWGRSLQGIAEAGEAWVEDKIAQGARNVAFIDLNKRYNDWMNTELQRIHTVNSNVSLNAAISYYYRSAKGANVDNTHINNAGTDQAAYWVWYDALARVAAGENAVEGSAAKVQADVLKGITEGCQGKIGAGGVADNLPWQVTDEIINAGAAPNAFWDMPVSSGFDYANDAVVANVAATTNADGTVTISGVTMRILNPNNYYKAVIDIISADSATTNRYYSYYNYDIGGAGKVSGDLVDPNEPGFLAADKGKDAVVAADLETLTIPAGGRAEVWIAEADAGTWQVGANEPCSPKYPVEWWSEVLLDDDCSDALTWTLLTQAVTTTNVVDGAIYFSTTGANADNTKKNFGYYPARFSSGMGAGRYRITCRAKMDSGTINFELGDSIHNTTTLFNNKTTVLSFSGTTVTTYNSTTPMVTVDENGDEQNVVNKLRWMDVDIILDRDNDRAQISVGGSDYVEYRNAARMPGDEFDGRTWNYFGITCPGQQSSYGYIDDLKIVKLAPVVYPTVTATASIVGTPEGTLTINGYATNALTIYSGGDFAIKASASNPDWFAFVCWRDGDGNDVSSNATHFVGRATEDVSATAMFRTYGVDEPRVTKWDFSDYLAGAVTATAAESQEYSGLEIFLASGDTLAADGLHWGNVGSNKSGTSVGESGRHIEWTAPYDGSVTITFQVGSIDTGKKVYPYLMVATNEQAMVTSGAYAQMQANSVDADFTLTFDVTAGTLYKIYAYYYNRNSTVTISDITYVYGFDFDVDRHNFVWNPAVAEGAWNNSANWLYDGVVPATTYPSEASRDVAAFSSEATVTLAANATASNVLFNSAVTLTGGYGIATTMVAGEGAVTLNNSGFDSLSGKDIVISNDLWVVGVATNWVNQNNASAYIYGNLKGNGIINLHNSSHTYKGAKLYGNNMDFAGEVIYDGGSSSRRYQRWDSGNATSSNAFWRVESGVPTGGVSNNDGDMMNSSGTYYFGGYSGNWWHRRYSNNYTMEIGAVNRDSDISIYTYTDAPNITKVGTANLTLGTTNIKNLTINGGSVTMPIGIAPNVLAMAAGSRICVPGDAAWAAGTSTNLFSYTTLSGVDVDALAKQVKVTGLAMGLSAKVSAEGNAVVATIKRQGAVVIVF